MKKFGIIWIIYSALFLIGLFFYLGGCSSSSSSSKQILKEKTEEYKEAILKIKELNALKKQKKELLLKNKGKPSRRQFLLYGSVSLAKPFKRYDKSLTESVLRGIEMGLKESNQYSKVIRSGNLLYVLSKKTGGDNTLVLDKNSGKVYKVSKRDYALYRAELSKYKEFQKKLLKYKKFQKRFLKDSISIPNPPEWIKDPDFFYSSDYRKDLMMKIKDMEAFLVGAETLLNKSKSERLAQKKRDQINRARARDSLLARARLVGIEIKSGTILASSELDSLKNTYQKLKSITTKINLRLLSSRLSSDNLKTCSRTVKSQITK